MCSGIKAVVVRKNDDQAREGISVYEKLSKSEKNDVLHLLRKGYGEYKEEIVLESLIQETKWKLDRKKDDFNCSSKLFDHMSFKRGTKMQGWERPADAIPELSENLFFMALFPALAWFMNPFQSVLIMTTHKLVLGFLIGPMGVSLENLASHENEHFKFLRENRRVTIVLDEFELQHDAMLKVLSMERQINDPPAFQSFMHQNATNWKSQGGLIQAAAEAYLAKYPEPMPSSFCSHDADEKEPFFLFHSGGLLSTSGVYAEQKDVSYVLHKRPVHPQGIKTESINSILGKQIDRCLFWINKGVEAFENGDWELADFFADIFNRVAGEPRTAHGLIFKSPEQSLGVRKWFGQEAIEDKERMTRSESHMKGFRFLLLSPAGYGNRVSDHPFLRVTWKAMSVTPERLLVQAALERFIFGISATSCLPRLANHFDMGWVKTYLKERGAWLPDDEVMWLDGLKRMIHEKTARFSVDLQIVPALMKLNFSNWSGYFNDDDAPHEGSGSSYRQKRFTATWDMISRISREEFGGGIDTALLFMTSFRHIKRLLEESEKRPALFKGLCDQIQARISPCGESEEKESEVWRVDFLDGVSKPVMLFFLDAKKYKEKDGPERKGLRRWINKMGTEARDSGAKLIALVLYASSERGVNLLFEADNGITSEFDAVGIVEVPYFHFSGEEEKEGSTLQVCRILQKFMDGGVMSRNMGEAYLRKIMESSPHYSRVMSQLQGAHKKASYSRVISELQGAHKKTLDYAVSVFASTIQACGRIVRDWQHPRKRVFLFSDLSAEALLPAADNVYIQKALPLMGPLAASIFGMLRSHATEKAKEKRREQKFNIRAEKVIDHLVQVSMKKCRQGDARYDRFPAAWEGIRRSLLRGDFLAEIPSFYLMPQARHDEKTTTRLLDWAYEPCEESWRGDSMLLDLFSRLSLADNKQMLVKAANREMRLEGVILPIEHNGLFYRPCDVVLNNVIRPAIAELLVLEALNALVGNRYSRYFHDDRRVFELFDLYIPDPGIALDVKLWSLSHILAEDDSGQYQEKAQKRLSDIREVLGAHVKLVYVLCFDNTGENRITPSTPFAHGADKHLPFAERMSKEGVSVVRMLEQASGYWDYTREFTTFVEWIQRNAGLSSP